VTDFEQLYNTYFNDVYLYILRLSGDEYIAEEITSDTFFKALKSIDSFRGDCEVRVWLCQIAKNCYYSYINKRKRTEQPNENETQESSEFAPSVAEEYARRDEIGQIQKILHDIGEPYKEVFMLSVFGQISLKEISRIFGKSESWARVTFYRAKQKLIEKMR